MNSPVLGIVILNYHNYEFLETAVQSIEKSTGLSKYHKVFIVVDSASYRKNFRRFRSQHSQWYSIAKKQNLGCARGYNLGLRYLYRFKPRFVLLMNSDVFVEPRTLYQLVDRLNKETTLGGVNPKILYATKPATIYFAGGGIDPVRFSGNHRGHGSIDWGQFDDKSETEILNMAIVLLRFSAIECVGPLDERYFLYYEDTDYSMRLNINGYSLGWEPNAVAWHTRTKGKEDKHMAYYLARNLILFLNNYARFPQRLRAYISTAKECFYCLINLLRKPRNREYNINMIRGIYDGMRGISGYTRL